jgi:hypothetical protein
MSCNAYDIITQSNDENHAVVIIAVFDACLPMYQINHRTNASHILDSPNRYQIPKPPSTRITPFVSNDTIYLSFHLSIVVHRSHPFDTLHHLLG